MSTSLENILSQIAALPESGRIQVLEALKEHAGIELFDKEWTMGTGLWRNSFTVEIFSSHPLDADSTLLDLYKETTTGNSTGWVQNDSIFEVTSEVMNSMLLERSTDADVYGLEDDQKKDDFPRPAW